MRVYFSRNRMKIRGIRFCQHSVLGGWQNALCCYLPGVSIAITYGAITNKVKI